MVSTYEIPKTFGSSYFGRVACAIEPENMLSGLLGKIKRVGSGPGPRK